MTPTDGFEHSLRGWFQDETASAPPLGLHDSAIDRARHARQRSGWLVAVQTRTPGVPAVAGRFGVAVLWVLVGIALTLAVLAAAVAGGVIRLQAAVPVQQYVEDGQLSGLTTSSREFGLPLTFKLLSGRGDRSAVGEESWWCSGQAPPENGQVPPQTSARMIALFYKKGCVSEVRFIRPFAVDCGTPDAHPDAETIAAAILGRIDTATDLGTVGQASTIPEGMFLGSHRDRVIQTGNGTFRPDAVDPERCRLLADPTGHDPTVEIRRDMPSTLVLMDVRGELVVLRIAGGGYDGPTGAAADERGYLRQVPSHIYDEIFDIAWN